MNNVTKTQFLFGILFMTCAICAQLEHSYLLLFATGIYGMLFAVKSN